MSEIVFPSTKAGNEVDRAVTAALSTIPGQITQIDTRVTALEEDVDDLSGLPAQVTQIGSKLDDLASTIGVFSSDLFEIGNITINENGWTYSTNATRVRTRQGVSLHLYVGDVISLSSYSDARFYLGWLTDGTYYYKGWNTEDFTVTQEGEYVILLSNNTAATQTSVDALYSLLTITTKGNIEGVYGDMAELETEISKLGLSVNGEKSYTMNNSGSKFGYVTTNGIQSNFVHKYALLDVPADADSLYYNVTTAAAQGFVFDTSFNNIGSTAVGEHTIDISSYSQIYVNFFSGATYCDEYIFKNTDCITEQVSENSISKVDVGLLNLVNLIDSGKLSLDNGAVSTTGADSVYGKRVRSANAFVPPAVISAPNGYLIATVNYYSTWTDASTYTHDGQVTVGKQYYICDQSKTYMRIVFKRSDNANFTYTELEDALNLVSDTVTALRNRIFGDTSFSLVGYINPSTGAYVSGATSWLSTDYIPIIEGDVINLYSAATGSVDVAYYDGNKSYLSSVSIAGTAIGLKTYTAPAGARYYRCSAIKAQVSKPYTYISSVIYEQLTKVLNTEEQTSALLYDSIKKPIEFRGKTIRAFGDSITWGVCSPNLQSAGNNRYISLFADYVGASVSIHAVSGSTLTTGHDNVGSIYDKIQTVSSNADIIWVAGGVNDWQLEAPIGTYGSTDTTNVYGAMTAICEYIKTTWPNAVVIFVTPIPTTSLTCFGKTHPDNLDDYRKTIQEVAMAYGFNVVNGADLGMPTFTGGFGNAMVDDTDCVHPTLAGHALYARSLCGKLCPAEDFGEISSAILLLDDRVTELKNSTEIVETEEWGGVLANCNANTNNNVFWMVLDAENETKPTHITKILYKVGANATTTFYKVTQSGTTATCTTIGSVTNSTAGEYEYEYDADLGDDEYIGFSGGISYKTSTTGYRYHYVSASGGTYSATGNAMLGIRLINEVTKTIADVEERVTALEESFAEFKQKTNEIVVDIHGNGDYTNPFDAIAGTLGKDTAANPITIKVMPGTYSMPTLAYSDFSRYCTNRYLAIVGVDKVNCILRNDVGYYNASMSDASNLGDNSPLKLSGNIYIANLTIISTDDDNESNEDELYHRSYCIHIDSLAAEGSIMEVHNCHLVNDHAPCIGFGIPKNCTIKITDCEMEADFYAPTYIYGGAVIYGHDRSSDTENITEHLVVKNCTMVSSNGHAVKVINNNSALMDVSFTNCVCNLASGKGVSLGSTTTLTPLCFGNNIAAMNYTT